MTEFAADLGVYFNLPLSSRFALGSKLLLGRSVMQEVDLDATMTGGRRVLTLSGDTPSDGAELLTDTYTSEFDYFTVGGNNSMKFGTGLSLTFAYKENYAWRLFLDYDYTRKTYTMTYNPGAFLLDATNLRDFADEDDVELYEQQSVKKSRHTFILGGSFTVSF